MKKIELELDQETYEKIEQLSKNHDCQISQLITAMIEQLTQPEIMNDSSIGQWSKDSKLVNQLVEDVLKHRT